MGGVYYLGDKMQKLKYVKPSDIKPYENNPRINHNAALKLADSIRIVGWRKPIYVDEKMVIVAGHTAWIAATLLQLNKISVIIDDDWSRNGMSSDECKKMYRIADNRMSEFSDWDWTKLFDESQGIPADFIGFQQGEIEKKMEAARRAADQLQEGEGREIEFTDELMLEHNYIVIYFTNPFDWNVAIDRFGLKQVKDLIPRKGQPTGIGRVIDGASVLKMLEGVENEISK